MKMPAGVVVSVLIVVSALMLAFGVILGLFMPVTISTTTASYDMPCGSVWIPNDQSARVWDQSWVDRCADARRAGAVAPLALTVTGGLLLGALAVAGLQGVGPQRRAG